MTAEPDRRSLAASSPDGAGRILVLGATGYVGGRLVPELLRLGRRVRCLVRDGSRLPSAWADDVEPASGDLLRPDSLAGVFDDVDVVVYLVHSMDDGDGFEARECRCARNARRAAEAAGVRRIVYLSGLGVDDDDLSKHLSSRHATGVELAAGPVPVVELRSQPAGSI